MQPAPKLVLTRDTLRALSPAEMDAVQGGTSGGTIASRKMTQCLCDTELCSPSQGCTRTK